MRFFRKRILLALLVVVAIVAYTYWSGYGWTLRRSPSSIDVEADEARRRGTDLAKDAAAKAARYYQIYDANSGRLIVQSAALEPLGLHYTPNEVRAFRDAPRCTTWRPTNAESVCRTA